MVSLCWFILEGLQECLTLGNVPCFLFSSICQVTCMFTLTFMVLQVLSSRILLVRSLKTERFFSRGEKYLVPKFGWELSTVLPMLRCIHMCRFMTWFASLCRPTSSSQDTQWGWLHGCVLQQCMGGSYHHQRVVGLQPPGQPVVDT